MDNKIYSNQEYIDILYEMKEIEDIKSKVENSFNENIDMLCVKIIRDINHIDQEIADLKKQFLFNKREKEKFSLLLDNLIEVIKYDLDKENDFVIQGEIQEFYFKVKKLLQIKIANNLFLDEIAMYQKRYNELFLRKREIEKEYRLDFFSFIKNIIKHK